MKREALWGRFGGRILMLVVLVALIGIGSMLVGGADEDAEAAMSTPVTEQLPEVDGEEETAVIATDNGVTLPVLDDPALIPAADPETFQNTLPTHQFVTHVVERGETPSGIAAQYGITPETILGGNPQLSEESSLLQTGVELIILPEDGVLHTVQVGDTLEGLVEQYGIPAERIIAYERNNLTFPFRLEPGSQIMIPGAVVELFVWTPPDLSSVGGTSSIGGNVVPVIVGTGSFIYPVGYQTFTQYFWYGHPGIDIGLPVGSAVYASDTGTVTYAGWNVFGYGNLIVVNHGNGYETFYAHLSGFNVVPGQIVYQGNVIGYSGNTGNSTGPHIHFEIRLNNNRENPCWYLGCG